MINCFWESRQDNVRFFRINTGNQNNIFLALHFLQNSHDLLGRLAFSENDFGKSLAQGAVMIDVSIGNVFIGHMLKSFSGISGAGLAIGN